MKKTVRIFILAALALALASFPALAGESFTLHALGAEITVGTGAAVDLGDLRNISIFARVTAGSGTVNPFDVWTECSVNGSTWSECSLDDRVEATTTGAGPHSDNTIKLIAETAVTTSGSYAARVTSLSKFIRARWNIAGSTPSETFEVIVLTK